MLNFKLFDVPVSRGALIGAILGVLTAFILSAVATISAVNSLFGTNIPIELETILAVTWLSMIVSAIFKGSSK
jgi:hypothetical protein